MFGFLRRDKNKSATGPAAASDKGVLTSLRSRLGKTRHHLTEGLAELLLGKKTIDAELLDEIETRLLSADVGIEATQRIIGDLTKRVSRHELKDADALLEALSADMVNILQPCEQVLDITPPLPPSAHADGSPSATAPGVALPPASMQSSPATGEGKAESLRDIQVKRPFVLLVVGINGAGKTTTIGKLAKRFQDQGHSVMLAAGDTFRAAAVEQLQTWGERNKVPVIAQGTGADSASVIFDAVESARARHIDIVIADTAGRLHTQNNLMEELIKIKRVLGKLDAAAPHEVMLVMDASFGQNGLVQAQQFHQALGVTGITLTKLDGTAKGGMLFAIAEKLHIPIRFIGVGESMEDLREFHAGEFVDALLDRQ